jgi:glycosyltransferase involved in cell wall biosynthesis
MRILYFYQYFTTPKGAWGTRVYEFAKRWVAAGDSVTVVTSVYDKSDLMPTSIVETFDVEGIEIKAINVRLSNKHGMLARIWTFLAYAAIASWYAMTLKADVVVASSGPITAGIPGLLGRFLRRKPFVFEVRDLWPQGAIELGYLKRRWIVWLARGFEQICYRAASKVIALSEGMAEGVLQSHPDADVVTVPNASDHDLFGSEDTRPAPEGLDEDRPLALYTGTLGQADDCAQIVRAAGVLNERGRTDIQIVLIGDGKERAQLETMAQDQKLSSVKFTGLMPKTEVARWLRRATCALITFKAVPFTDTMSPNKMYDAFAAGIPIVQTTQGWIKQLTKTENCGITVRTDDAQALANVIESLVDQPLLRAEISLGE